MKKRVQKKLGSLLLCGVMAVTLLVGCGSGSSDTADTGKSTGSSVNYDNKYCEDGKPSAMLTELREKGVWTIGSSGDSYAYIDQDTGEFSGIDAVICKEIAKRLGIKKVEMKLINFSELIVNLNEGNIDMIADGMYQNADRAKQIYYGNTWYTQGGILVVPEDSKIEGQDTFDSGSTVVGYTEGTIWQKIVEQWQEDGLIKEARATGDQSSSLTALQYGKIDAFLSDSTVMEDMKARTPESLKGLKFAENYKDPELAVGHISPSVSFENIAFMKEVNNVVEEMRAEGFIEQAFKDCGLDPSLHTVPDDEIAPTVNTREE
nr:transporter substrate-binding domain-containing protein [uncultured Agathobacter sp.]